MPGVDTEAIAEGVTEEVSNSFQLLMHLDLVSTLKIILTAVLLLIACLVIKNLMLKALDHVLDRSHIEKNLHAFLRSAVKMILWFITIMIVAGSFGIDTKSLVAVLGVAGLALSLSIQGSLSNLAGGITILTTKPFMVGNFVEIGTVSGTVLEIGMVYTKLTTLDNRRIVLPNSTVTTARVTNYSSEPNRRVDIDISASYDAPIEVVKRVLEDLIAQNPQTFADPEPLVRVLEYGDHAIKYAIRVWCKNEDYWDVFFDLQEGIKTVFDANHIEMTYPHVNVHMVQDGGCER